MKIYERFKDWLSEEVDEMEFENPQEEFDDYLFGSDPDAYKRSRRTRLQVFRTRYMNAVVSYQTKKFHVAYWWENHRGLFKTAFFGTLVFLVYRHFA